MPSLKRVLARFTKQTAVYWQKTGIDGFNKPSYADPVELKVRWEDKFTEVLTPDGRKVISKGYILLGTKLEPGSLVYLGSLASWRAQTCFPKPPTMKEGGQEVLVCNDTPDINAIDHIFEAYL